MAGVACRHAAGPAGVFDTDAFTAYLQTGLLKKDCNCQLLLIETKRLDGIGKVFYRKKLVIASYHGDANGVDVGIQKVCAVTFGVHPEVVDHSGVGGFGYVFRDETEACAGPGSADGKIGFAGKLMGDLVVSRHLAGMVESCLGENGVAMERWKAMGGSVLIGGGEEVLLRYVRHRCRLLGGPTTGKSDGGCREEQSNSKRFIANLELLPHEKVDPCILFALERYIGGTGSDLRRRCSVS
jgi:hypothetical protein